MKMNRIAPVSDQHCLSNKKCTCKHIIRFCKMAVNKSQRICDKITGKVENDQQNENKNRKYDKSGQCIL